MKKFVLICLLFPGISTVAQTNISIIPKPVELNLKSGYFNLSNSTVIIANAHAKHDADMLNYYLQKLYGLTLPIKDIPAYNHAKNEIEFIYLKPERSRARDQYDLNVDSGKIKIVAESNEALFYGIQTLLQLLPAEKDSTGNQQFLKIPEVEIKDYPRFQYRGMHLDVGRHFFGVDEIKKYIDYLAYHKFNTFHWHLTEDQGWRIEIKRYPFLTSVGGFRNGTIIGHNPGTGNDSLHYGGFYTQKK